MRGKSEAISPLERVVTKLNTAVSAVHVVKTSASLIISVNNTVANTYSNVLIAVSDIRRCAVELRRRNVQAYDGENYVAIINPMVSEDLRSDSTFQNWHQYTTPEYLYRGEIGRVEGCFERIALIKTLSDIRRTLRSQRLGRGNPPTETKRERHRKMYAIVRTYAK